MGYIREHSSFLCAGCLTYVTSKGEILPSAMDSNGTDGHSSEQSSSEESDDENTKLVEKNNEIVEESYNLFKTKSYQLGN